MKDNNIEVVKYRKKIFSSKKYKEYFDVINKMIIPEQFDYKDCIPKIFSSKEYEKINKYEIEPYKSFYEFMKNDIKNYQKNIETNDVILVVHPFYPIIRHANILILDYDYFLEYKKYENKIIDLLKNSKKDIILFESPDSFACYTHLFTKYNRIKKIIFTQHSYGNVLNKNDLNILNEYNKISIAGCYKNHCIDDVLKQLNIENIEYINDCIIKKSKYLGG